VTPTRCFFTVLASDLDATRAFYVDALGFRSTFTSDWFVNLAVPNAPGLELGILRRDHELVPPDATSGGMLTVVVPNVDEVHAALHTAGHPIVEPPTNQFYGQRRMLVRDPAGTLVDISSECPPDPKWMARVRSVGDGYAEAPTGSRAESE